MNTLLKRITFIVVLCNYVAVLEAQISHGGMPYSFRKSTSLQTPDRKILPYSDNVRLLNEENSLSDKKNAFVFGKEIQVDYTLNNAGTWEVLSDGSRLWRLTVQSVGAYSLNLLFDRFYIPPSSSLFIYTEDKSYVMGAFTEENNNQWGNFATSLFPGDVLVLEYHEAVQDYGQGELTLSTVVHAYKNFFFKDGQYGSSGSCNVDVNCQTQSDYQTIKRAVALILNKGSAFCSGTLLNNTAQDGKPYFLTANHCIRSVFEASQFVFVFNYESTACNTTSEKTSYSINGATLLARYEHSDFALLLLNNTPPQHYLPYYAGWDSRNIATANTVCIHHPKGDLKKISFYSDVLESSNYNDENPLFPKNTHWEVRSWTKGTTESGSSGSALFNMMGQVIGQLEGGAAECAGNQPGSGGDWFGKISYSWTNNNYQGNNRLDRWLDPIGTGVEVLDGYDPYAVVSVREADASATEIHLYPNPADEILSIETHNEILSYTLYTVNGQAIAGDQTRTSKLTIPTSHLPQGIYMLKLQTDTGVLHRKLFIQH
jgi:hypothetical protein